MKLGETRPGAVTTNGRIYKYLLYEVNAKSSNDILIEEGQKFQGVKGVVGPG